MKRVLALLLCLLLALPTASGFWGVEKRITFYQDRDVLSPSVCWAANDTFLLWVASSTLYYRVFNETSVLSDNLTLAADADGGKDTFLLPIEGDSVHVVYHNNSNAYCFEISANGQVLGTPGMNGTLVNCTVLSAAQEGKNLCLLANYRGNLTFIRMSEGGSTGILSEVKLFNGTVESASLVQYNGSWHSIWTNGGLINYSRITGSSVDMEKEVGGGNYVPSRVRLIHSGEFWYMFFLMKGQSGGDPLCYDIMYEGMLHHSSGRLDGGGNGASPPEWDSIYTYGVTHYQGSILVHIAAHYHPAYTQDYDVQRTYLFDGSSVSQRVDFSGAPPVGKLAAGLFTDARGFAHIAYLDYVAKGGRSWPEGTFTLFHRMSGFLDIGVTNLTVFPGPPRCPGDIVTFNATIVNRGNTNALDVALLFNVTFGGNEVAGNSTLINLTPKETRPVNFTWPAGAMGDYCVTVRTIPLNDLNWSDNQATRAFTVAGRPDLGVDFFTGVTMYPEAPTDGDAVLFNVTVHNAGEGPGTGTLSGRLDAQSLGDKNITLGPGNRTTVSFTWNATLGPHNITGEVGNVTPPDADPSNNSRTLSFEVIKGNHAPVLNITTPAPMQNISSVFWIRGTASDPDGDAVSVRLSIDGGGELPATGSTSWSYAWNTSTVIDGLHNISVRASDGKLEALRSLTVRVNNSGSQANNTTLPDKLITGRWPASPATINETETLFLGIALISPGIPNSYFVVHWYQNDLNLFLYDNQTDLVFATNYTSAGNHTLKVSVALVTPQGTVKEDANWTVWVLNRNRPPVIKDTETSSQGWVGMNTRFRVNATDPDGDPLTYSWNVDGVPASSQQELNIKWKTAGKHILEINISDGSARAHQSWTVNVGNIGGTTRTDATPWLLLAVVLTLFVVFVGYLRLRKRKEGREE